MVFSTAQAQGLVLFLVLFSNSYFTAGAKGISAHLDSICLGPVSRTFQGIKAVRIMKNSALILGEKVNIKA